MTCPACRSNDHHERDHFVAQRAFDVAERLVVAGRRSEALRWYELSKSLAEKELRRVKKSQDRARIDPNQDGYA